MANNCDTNSSANTRITNIWEKACIGILMLLLGLVQMQYTSDRAESKQEIKELNVKVLELYRTSVTKQELKELESRLNANNEAIRSDIRNLLTLYLDDKVGKR